MQLVVALHVRAWVEIIRLGDQSQTAGVALHVRAWVEMPSPRATLGTGPVALHVRAWVEIPEIFDQAGRPESPSMRRA